MKSFVQKTFGKPNMQIMALICLCFLLTSTAYLAWAYKVMSLVSPRMADAISLAAGYFFQILGIGLFALFIRHRSENVRRCLYAVLSGHMLFLVPAVLSNSLAGVLLFGFIQNLLCGCIAGYYLYALTVAANAGNSAITLGLGYGISILASWLLSLPAKNSSGYTIYILLVCLAVSITVAAAARRDFSLPESSADESNTPSATCFPKELPPGSLLFPAGALVLVFSIVNSCGFGFPSADLQVGINLELSRLFYAAGLIIAGFVNNKNRRYGAVCAFSALVIPFIMLALKGEPVSLLIFWALSYFSFGFYTVYRIILFSDLAREKNLLMLSGFGLLIGRIGDILGESMNLLLSEHLPVLTILSAVLFIAAVVLFLKVYHLLYLPKTERERSEREIFNQFSLQHDLSAREREVLRLILVEKTNSEIAQELSVSESTVKFHIHNLLQKTGCKNRVALLSSYQAKQS